MSKLFLVIPAGIGIAAAIFVVMFFGGNDVKNNSDFTLTDLTERASPYVGDSSAPITIVEFGDYQCTFCFKFHQSSLNTIKKEYIDSGKASLVFVDFPLNGPDSVLAAEATHCANDQGKFWAMHDEIYQNWNGERTGWVTRDSISQFAQTVGVDVDSLNQCLDSKKYQNKVLETYDFAQGIKIDATPSFLIISGDKVTKITGNQPLEVFRKVLDGI
ncbi:MAG: disulfide bond formation protein DsbA [Thaumarchaeota archaeon]|nr:disulfide bond formation protein DsbA [Nitrososphaerota archaeon]